MKSLILILGLVMAVVAQRRPPNYSQEYMPETSFDCRDKILGGYYADIETDCQMFHVCVKVPGIGVQDFRFLCPNDTSFDQENQICASWYEVDCEANVLFYSDNFDLYRIGHVPSSPAIASSSANPIPLGPSTVRPATRQSAGRLRPRPQVRPQEDEEEYYLQRSETGDRRLQQNKDLRISSSNYYGKNKGKEEDYSTDSYVKKTAKPYKPVVPTTAAAPTTYVTDNPTTLAKKKVAVRKLRKRPQQNVNIQSEDPTTLAPSNVAFNQGTYRGQNYNGQRNYDYNNAVTTQAPSSADNYNTYTQRYNTIQRNGNGFTQSTTQSSTSFAAYEGNYQQTNAQNDYNANYNFAQRTSSVKPVDYPTTSAPVINYQTIQRKTPDYSTTTLQTPVAKNYYQGNDNAAGSYQSTPNYQSSKYTNSNNYNYDFSDTYTSTAAPATYNQYNYQNAARNNNKPSSNVPVTTAAPAYSNFQTTSEAYKYNADNYNFQKTVQASFNAQPSYQTEEESLRTAQSSNYGPSNFNSYQNSYENKTPKPAANNYNYTGNYYTSSATPKSSAFSNVQRSTTVNSNAYTTKLAANYNYNSEQSTAAPPRPFSAAYSPTAPVSSRQPPFSTVVPTTKVATVTNRRPVATSTIPPSTKNPKDVSYDYAYYDEGNTEYDGQDPISDHHFGKGKESFKVARSAK